MCGWYPGVREVVGIKCTQVGWSLIAILAALFYLSVKAAKVVIAQPKVDAAQAFAEEDLDPIMDRTEPIRRITRPRIQGETKDKWWLRIFTNGATLRLVGAAANNAFRSYKALAMLLDEIDDEQWQDRSESGEGDKIGLARQRTQWFWNSVISMFSTPKNAGTSLVEREWKASDQRRFFMPCPACGHMQHLRFPQLRFKRDAKGNVTEAVYRCEGNPDLPAEQRCTFEIPESEKRKMIRKGHWRPTADPIRPGLRGYHTNRLISVSAKATWRHIGQEWFEAQDDVDKLKVFVTLTLGEPWEDRELGAGARDGLQARAEDYDAECPTGVKRMFMSVDTNEEGHADGSKLRGLEWAVMGVGEGQEAWVMAYGVLSEHEPWSPACIEQLDAIRRREWKTADGGTKRIDVTVCDRGAMPEAVMDYCRSRWQENVLAIKGNNVDLGKRLASIAPGKPSRNRRTGYTWWQVCTQSAKDLVDRRLRKETPGAGFIHFHKGLPARWFKGLASEKLKTAKGVTWWEKKSNAVNEPWDLLVYLFVAVELAKNASETLVNELATRTSRGPAYAPRIRFAGPNRAWVHPYTVLEVDTAAIAVADEPTPGVSVAPAEASAVPVANAPRPASEDRDPRPAWMRRGEGQQRTEEASEPASGERPSFAVRSFMDRRRYR